MHPNQLPNDEQMPQTVASPSSDEIKSGERVKQLVDTDYDEDFKSKSINRINNEDETPPTKRTPQMPNQTSTNVKKSV